MDTDRQLHEADAAGWQRGLYDDIKHTFRAPIVNWIFRTAMANEPLFLRYAWGQVKPIFETRGFARLTIAYRDAALGALEAEEVLPAYRPGEVEVSPAEYRELQGQLASYDVVAPRLAVLFETMDRALHDEPIGHAMADERAATAPVPAWLDRDRGRSPTLLEPGQIPDELGDTIDAIQAFHGFDDGLPSIYRTMAQWPSFLERLWRDVEPRLATEAFETACADVDDLVSEFVDASAYWPRLTPTDLAQVGFAEETIEGARGLFREFNTGPVETVLPALHAYAATVDASGEREWH